MWLSALLTGEALLRQAVCNMSWVRQPGQQNTVLAIVSICCISEPSHVLDQVA